MRISILCGVCFLGWRLFGATAQTGQLTVTVLDPAGKPAAGARVLISSRPLYDPAVKPGTALAAHNASALSNSAGQAAFSGLSPGAYAVCADLPGSQAVNTCTFVEKAAAARVTAGTPSATTVHLLAGATLNLAVSDPQQILQAAKPGGQQQFRISVSAPNGRRRYLALNTSTSTQRQYSLLAPVNTILEIHVTGSGFRVGDASGKQIDKKPILVFIPAGSQTHSLSVSLIPAP